MKNKFYGFLCFVFVLMLAGRGFSATSCAPGSYVVDNGCESCPVGTYSTSTNAVECVPCPNGKTTDGTGASSCSVCDVGYYGDGNTCTPCSAGTYSDSGGATECIECPFGKTTAGEGAISATNCNVACYVSGNQCNACPAGYCCGNGELYKCNKGTYAGEGQECDKTMEASYQASVCQGGMTRGDGHECSVMDMYVYKQGSCPGKCAAGCTTRVVGASGSSYCIVKTASGFCVGNRCFSWPDVISPKALGDSIDVNWECPAGPSQSN